MSKSQTTELKNVLDCNKAFLRNKEIYKKNARFLVNSNQNLSLFS